MFDSWQCDIIKCGSWIFLGFPFWLTSKMIFLGGYFFQYLQVMKLSNRLWSAAGNFTSADLVTRGERWEGEEDEFTLYYNRERNASFTKGIIAALFCVDRVDEYIGELSAQMQIQKASHCYYTKNWDCFWLLKIRNNQTMTLKSLDLHLSN